MTPAQHRETAERLLEKAKGVGLHAPARASYLAEAQLHAQLALLQLVELAAMPPALVIPDAVELDVDPADVQRVLQIPEPAAPKRRRSTKKPTEAAE